MPAPSKKRILVTGGAGFIGSHLVDIFLADGWSVGVVDDLSTGNQQNIAGKSVTFYQTSILDKDRLGQVFEDFRPTHVSHHAAQVSVRRSLEEPAHDAEINVVGTLNVLALAAKYKVQRLVFSSSGGAIYGENEARQPADESTFPQPVSPYALSKFAGEHYLNYYQKRHQLPVTILRYSNVYGPRQDPVGEAGVISLFLDKFRQSQPATIFGSGEQVRDFVYIDDLAAANLAATQRSVDGVVNIGTGQATSVMRLYQALVSLWQQSTGQGVLPPDMQPPVPGEIFWSQLDISKAKQVLNWQPKVSLEDGLKQTIEWFRK